MDIPALPCLMSGGSVSTGRLVFDGLVPTSSGDMDYIESTKDLMRTRERHSPLAVIDVKGINRRSMSASLLNSMRVRSASIWLMTCIENTDDLIDAFGKNASKLLIPIHLAISERALVEMLDMSDSCIPTVFAKNDLAQIPYGSERITDTVDRMVGIGFDSVAVFDTDGSIPDDEWIALGMRGTVIPFSQNAPEDLFADRFVSL